MLVITWRHLIITLELHYTLMNTGSNQYSVQYSSLADSHHCPGAKGIYVLKLDPNFWKLCIMQGTKTHILSTTCEWSWKVELNLHNFTIMVSLWRMSHQNIIYINKCTLNSTLRYWKSVLKVNCQLLHPTSKINLPNKGLCPPNLMRHLHPDFMGMFLWRMFHNSLKGWPIVQNSPL